MRFETKKIEDCFDGSRILEYRLEVPITRSFILALGSLGKLEYFEDFPRPFFRITTKSDIKVKGVEGEHTFKTIFSKESLADEREVFDRAILAIPVLHAEK